LVATTSVRLNVPLNRVEGDLEIRVEVESGVVTDAWSSGTMYRGFEKMLTGRGALDGLVITPRICGICGTGHLTAAVGALEAIAGVTPPPGAVRLRNITLMTEHIQSDMRHGFLMFAADFVNPKYAGSALYDEAVRRYAPLRGETAIEVLRETKKVLEIVAIIGGQWPHSSYMVPGGIVSIPSGSDLVHCRLLLRSYRAWYERRILGCSLERWSEVKSAADLDAWMDESDAHRESDLGFFLRFAREARLDSFGRGSTALLSFGSLPLPEGTAVASSGNGRLIPAGFARLSGGAVERSTFDQSRVAEHVAHSWFVDYDGGRHPFAGETQPYASGDEGGKYSWAKAPRYDGEPAETGPLAEAAVAGDPLVVDLLAGGGASVLVRELTRLVRPARLIPVMETWLDESQGNGRCYVPPPPIEDGEGFGLTHAARGALGHWVRISKGKIDHYQIITPTAWNASPRDSDHRRGPIEEALVGTAIADPENPVELGHVVRSFDACLVCTVHMLRRGDATLARSYRIAP
jgi:uptake hydrogenase large subunit